MKDPRLKAVVITTARELKVAITTWSHVIMDLEVRRHLDLSTNELWPGSGHRSIRGNCTGDPPKAMLDKLQGTTGLLPLKSGQCLILVSSAFWDVYRDNISWMDNMYLRMSPWNAQEGMGGTSIVSSPRMYLTNVTIQGDGVFVQSAIDSTGWGDASARTMLFAQDLVVANVCGVTWNRWQQGMAVSLNDPNTYANITRSTFRSNSCKHPKLGLNNAGAQAASFVSLSACGENLINCENVHVALQQVEFLHDNCSGAACPDDVELSGYLWAESDAPKTIMRDSSLLFGDPVYYSDSPLSVACPHCGETEPDKASEDGASAPAGGSAMSPSMWNAGIEGDVGALLDPSGVSVPDTWRHAQPLATLPGRAQAFMPSAEDELFVGLQEAWKNALYHQVTEEEIHEWDNYFDYGQVWEESEGGWGVPSDVQRTGIGLTLAGIIVVLALVITFAAINSRRTREGTLPGGPAGEQDGQGPHGGLLGQGPRTGGWFAAVWRRAAEVRAGGRLMELPHLAADEHEYGEASGLLLESSPELPAAAGGDDVGGQEQAPPCLLDPDEA